MLNTLSSWVECRVARQQDVLFVSSAPIDELWVRTTAVECAARGLRTKVVVCGGDLIERVETLTVYEAAGVSVSESLRLVDAARMRARIVVTASSGLSRVTNFATRAPLLVHMPHSIVSLHMIYPAGAFDGYDVLLSVGPHHDAEFTALAQARGLENRRAYPVGYGKLDLLASVQATRAAPAKERPLILIAPSWGPDNLLDRCGVQLAQALADVGCDVVVRPHPLFFIEGATVVAQLAALAARRPEVSLESPLEGDRAIHEADVLVGDYSGSSFEFAALRRRSVVSVNVGLKIANPDWRRLGLDPVEVALRANLGPVVEPVVADIVRAVQACTVPPTSAADRQPALPAFLHAPPGGCAAAAARVLAELLQEI